MILEVQTIVMIMLMEKEMKMKIKDMVLLLIISEYLTAIITPMSFYPIWITNFLLADSLITFLEES